MPLSAVLPPGVYIDQVGLGVLLGKKKKNPVLQCSRRNPQFSKYTYIMAYNSLHFSPITQEVAKKE